jgi:hypothetical protein
MRKLKLELEGLDVQSFETGQDELAVGTVRGASPSPSTYYGCTYTDYFTCENTCNTCDQYTCFISCLGTCFTCDDDTCQGC